ncbi:MAG: hypothetical protein V3V47_00435 [Desulfobacteria bacterium]
MPNTSKAVEFQLHAEGGPFAFKIVRVQDFTSRNNDSGYPDKLKMSLDAIGDPVEGHCNMVIFPLRNDTSFELRMLCEATGISAEGGNDSDELVGKCFQAEIYQFEWNEKSYAGLKPKTIAPYESADDDETLPF